MNLQNYTQATPQVTRVLLVDDDAQIQSSLKQALESQPGLLLVGQSYSVAEARIALDQLEPDVVLVDLCLPDGNGLELISHIHQSMPNCESMVLTVLGDESHVISCIEAGATGYLTKDTLTPEVVERLKQLRAGGSPISPMIARRLLTRFRGTSTASGNPLQQDNLSAPKPQPKSVVPLSEREQEVLEMVAKGFKQAEIANLLGVSINTVSTYVKRIYRKLAVNSRTSAVHKANALGLIRLKDF